MQQVNIVHSLNFNQMNGGMWTCASADYDIYQGGGRVILICLDQSVIITDLINFYMKF